MGKDQIKYEICVRPCTLKKIGFSLGVDIVPYKTCTFDCIYCQIGRTTQKSVERRLYARRNDVLREIKEV